MTRLRPSQIMSNFVNLERAPVLFTLVDPQLRRLARRLRPIELGRGTRVIQANQAGGGLYLIEHGSCGVAVETQPDHLVTVARLREGDVFGETALIDEPSAVSVITLDDCRLLAADRTSLRAVLPTDGPEASELRPLILRRQEAYRELAGLSGRVNRPGEAVVTAVYAPKGGSGRTTIALNLAAQLARGNPGSVLLIDLDLPYTQAALLCGLIPNGSLTTASWRASLGTDSDLEDALIGAAQLHTSGFMVLPAVVKVEESELIEAEQVSRALKVLRTTFRHIVVDLGISLNELSLGVFDAASHAIVVVAPELPSLRGGQDALRIIHDLMHFPEEGIKVVLNQRQANAVVPRATVERALGRPPDAVIGYDGDKPERAALKGAILAVSDRKSQISKGTLRLAELLEASAARAGASS
jgi:pilus assembly protein CpaE